jgi:hypothetical protein
MVPLSAVAYFLSSWLAGGIELIYPSQSTKEVAPMLAGGCIGALLLLGGTLLLANGHWLSASQSLKVVMASVACGLLG